MNSLYDISQEYQEAFTFLSDPANMFDEELIENSLAAIKDDFDTKATNIVNFANNLVSSNDAIDAEIKRLQALKKQRVNKSNGLKEYLKRSMEATGITEISCPLFTIKIRNNPPAVVVDNEDSITGDYIKEKVTYSIDKIAIKNDIKAGKEVAGCHLESSTKLSIK